jgi:hypothetical protein
MAVLALGLERRRCPASRAGIPNLQGASAPASPHTRYVTFPSSTLRFGPSSAILIDHSSYIKGVTGMQTNMVCPWRPTALKIAVSFCVLGAIASEAAAQQPTKAQENALRSACRKDFIAHCSKVKPSGPAALACLQRNAASLSSACRTAVSAVGGGPAPAGSAPAGAAPAGAAPAAAAPDQPAPTQAATATAPTQGAGNQTSDQQPTKAQENAIRSACRKDFISHCSKVKPSGPAALACLQRNAASLSSACRTAVSAVGGGSAAAAATPSARRTSARPSPYVRLRRLLREWHR